MAYQPPNIYSVHGISSAGTHTHHPIHERTYVDTARPEATRAWLWVEFPLLRTPPRLPSVTPTRLAAQSSRTRSARTET